MSARERIARALATWLSAIAFRAARWGAQQTCWGPWGELPVPPELLTAVHRDAVSVDSAGRSELHSDQ